MKKNNQILIIVVLLLFSCKSKNVIIGNSENGKMEFNFLEVEQPFNLELTEFHENNFYCFTEGIPYAILIGKTNNTSLPNIVTVLSRCEERNFTVGQNLRIVPEEDPRKNVNLNLIYSIKDTIISGKKKSWLIGAENKAIWGIAK